MQPLETSPLDGEEIQVIANKLSDKIRNGRVFDPLFVSIPQHSRTSNHTLEVEVPPAKFMSAEDARTFLDDNDHKSAKRIIALSSKPNQGKTCPHELIFDSSFLTYEEQERTAVELYANLVLHTPHGEHRQRSSNTNITSVLINADIEPGSEIASQTETFVLSFQYPDSLIRRYWVPGTWSTSELASHLGGNTEELADYLETRNFERAAIPEVTLSPAI